MKDNLEKCAYVEISVTQRETERARGIGDAGTIGYEKMGCYECDGLNKECPSYIVFNSRESK